MAKPDVVSRFTNKMAEVHRPFAKYPAFINQKDLIMFNQELSKSAILLYLYISMKKKKWTFNMGIISKNLGMPYKTVSKARRELIQKGYLRISHGRVFDYIHLGKKMPKPKLKEKTP